MVVCAFSGSALGRPQLPQAGSPYMRCAYRSKAPEPVIPGARQQHTAFEQATELELPTTCCFRGARRLPERNDGIFWVSRRTLARVRPQRSRSAFDVFPGKTGGTQQKRLPSASVQEARTASSSEFPPNDIASYSF